MKTTRMVMAVLGFGAIVTSALTGDTFPIQSLCMCIVGLMLALPYLVRLNREEHGYEEG